MSGIEILGIAASVVQIAELGGKLSVKLFTFSRKIKNADRSIDSISRDIAATGAVLQQLGHELKNDEELRLCSSEAVCTARGLVDDCNRVFLELDDALGGKGPKTSTHRLVVLGWKDRIKYPFLEAHIELLRSNLERLKSSLLVMLNVLIFAEQLRNRTAAPELQDQRELINKLIDDKVTNQQRFEKVMKALEGFKVDERASAGITTPIMVQNMALPANNTPPVFEKLNSDKLDSLDYGRGKVSSLPEGLRHRKEEIEHHCALVTRLVHEVSNMQYKIDHGLRDRMQRGVLGVHWEEWSPLSVEFGPEPLLELFSSHADVVRFWNRQLELVSPLRAHAQLSPQLMQSKQQMQMMAQNAINEQMQWQMGQTLQPQLADYLYPCGQDQGVPTSASPRTENASPPYPTMLQQPATMAHRCPQQKQQMQIQQTQQALRLPLLDAPNLGPPIRSSRQPGLLHESLGHPALEAKIQTKSVSDAPFPDLDHKDKIKSFRQRTQVQQSKHGRHEGNHSIQYHRAQHLMTSPQSASNRAKDPGPHEPDTTDITPLKGFDVHLTLERSESAEIQAELERQARQMPEVGREAIRKRTIERRALTSLGETKFTFWYSTAGISPNPSEHMTRGGPQLGALPGSPIPDIAGKQNRTGDDDKEDLISFPDEDQLGSSMAKTLPSGLANMHSSTATDPGLTSGNAGTTRTVPPPSTPPYAPSPGSVSHPPFILGDLSLRDSWVPDQAFNLDFSGLETSDVLNNFDFDSSLNNAGDDSGVRQLRFENNAIAIARQDISPPPQERETDGEIVSDLMDERPVFINAKQYHRILKRRVARERIEQLFPRFRARRPALHSSSHHEAIRRPRGQGGRFLTSDEVVGMEDSDLDGEKSESSLITAPEIIVDSAPKRQADALEHNTPIKRSKFGSERAEDSEYVIVGLDEANISGWEDGELRGSRRHDVIQETGESLYATEFITSVSQGFNDPINTKNGNGGTECPGGASTTTETQTHIQPKTQPNAQLNTQPSNIDRYDKSKLGKDSVLSSDSRIDGSVHSGPTMDRDEEAPFARGLEGAGNSSLNMEAIVQAQHEDGAAQDCSYSSYGSYGDRLSDNADPVVQDFEGRRNSSIERPPTQPPKAWDAIDELVLQWTILSHDDIVALSSTSAGGREPAQSFP